MTLQQIVAILEASVRLQRAGQPSDDQAADVTTGELLRAVATVVSSVRDHDAAPHIVGDLLLAAAATEPGAPQVPVRRVDPDLEGDDGA